MHYLESIFRVLVVGLILGAGLPAVFASGLVAYSTGSGGADGEGFSQAPNAVLKALGLALFVLVGLVIVAAILWITRGTIQHHFGVDLFPFMKK